MTEEPVEHVELRILGGDYKFIDFECPEYDPASHEHTVERIWIWLDQAQRLVDSTGLMLEGPGGRKVQQFAFAPDQYELLKTGLRTAARNFEALGMARPNGPTAA